MKRGDNVSYTRHGKMHIAQVIQVGRMGTDAVVVECVNRRRVAFFGRERRRLKVITQGTQS